MANKNIYITIVVLSALVAVVLYVCNSFTTRSGVHSDAPHTFTLENSANTLIPANVVSTFPASQSTEPDEEVKFINEALSEQLSLVASVYERSARYPNYSTPVDNDELAKTPQPFAQARVEMKTFDENGELLPITISASVDKLRYVVGEDITFQVLIAGVDHYSSVFINTIVKPTDSDTLFTDNITLQAIGDGNAEFLATIDSESLELGDPSKELLAVVEVEIDGARYINTVPFMLSSRSATLNGISYSIQQGPFLEIGLDYDVEQSGYYFVNAYLDDAKTGKVLLRLQGEDRLAKGSSQLTLKAHQQALKDAGSQGPYHLRINRSYRGAEPGEGDDKTTAIAKGPFSIPYFSFDGYANEQYSNPMVEARLQVLKSLASSN